ncbi:FUSC family protein [Streptomyces sp. NPDC048659]|uniref:FUSC family protein n=1 Tax=Streptomyces sp. NPDC048659 TaxID=3155489 RepID=UPI00343DE99B
MVLKTVVAALLSWWAADALFHLPQPMLAPAGAILTAQVTPYGTMRKALQRAAGVVFGVLLGAAVATLIGTDALALVTVMLVGMFAGRLLRLGPQMHQVALTGILVLGSSEHLGYGTARLEDNILGILVGTAVALAVPTPGFVDKARADTAALTKDMSVLLTDMAGALDRPDWGSASGRWVAAARAISVRLDLVQGAVTQARDASRWRSRRRAAEVDRLAEAATALEHISHQIRGIARGLYDLNFREGRSPALQDSEPQAHGLAPAAPPGLDGLLEALGAVLTDVADRHLGPGTPAEQDSRRLRALLGEAETRFLDCAVTQSPTYGHWSVLCTAGILEDTRKMLHELDPDLGPHQHAFR